MGPKRKERESLESLLARPWCYYCDRDFDDIAVLHNHQKAKHYHCIVGTCNRRLNTAGGLVVHMEQVHKEKLESVPNALPDRQGLYPEIFGMEGVPQAMLDQRTAQVIREYSKLESDWRARTGNPLSGTQTAKEEAEQGRKRQKVAVDKDELKRRAAAAKAALAAKKHKAEMDKKFGEGWDAPEPELNTGPPLSGEMTPETAKARLADATPPVNNLSPYPGSLAAMSINSGPNTPATVAAAPVSASPFQVPLVMPPNNTSGLSTPVAAQISASPHPIAPSISPPGYPMYAPPRVPMGANAHSPASMTGYGVLTPGTPVPARAPAPTPGYGTLPGMAPTQSAPVSAYGAPPSGLPARLNWPPPRFPGTPSNASLPPRPNMLEPASTLEKKAGMTEEDSKAFIKDQNQKFLARDQETARQVQNLQPKVEAGASLIYSDNILSPEEKKSFHPRYLPDGKTSTTPTMGQTQAVTGPVEAY
ncbi:hypothetical protein DOTSEDRAFT_70683 [Dothistroma septosporum NZE10]|uniref:C2H2-type domain-containing protein n=1 Tax=Dothistroma septosporum (strain NZE10 / CBS 128990) TaxID=675120 RepID=N1PX48_DOTSN|nr:hypothetical protein DOTSEDRAFT_70683 [Dothistroma septosporum NZE10]